MKRFVCAMLVRAAHTFAQTALGMLVVGQTLAEVDWVRLLSAAAVAAVISVLKSAAVGLPEVTGVSPDE